MNSDLLKQRLLYTLLKTTLNLSQHEALIDLKFSSDQLHSVMMTHNIN